MTKRELEQWMWTSQALAQHGMTDAHIEQLRLIGVRLRSWFERECGMGNGCIERDEETGRPFWHSSVSGRKFPIRDMETGARKRLAAIMAQYPSLTAYVQTDPRGAALYILRPGDVPEGCSADAYYTRGICVAV